MNSTTSNRLQTAMNVDARPFFKTAAALGVATLCASLVACGGGGSSDTNASAAASADSGSAAVSSGTTTTTTTPGTPAATRHNVVQDAGTLITTPQGSTYSSSGLQLIEYTWLNAIRLHAGAGQVAHNAVLDITTAAHLTYDQRNNHQGTDEDQSLPGFTGLTPGARMTGLQFATGAADEVLSFGGTPGLSCVFALLNTAYHSVTLLKPFTNVGFAIGGGSATVAPNCVIDVAAPPADALVNVPPVGQIVGYPYPGEKSLLRSYVVDNESPRPPTTVLANRTAGTPVIVNIRNADYWNWGVTSPQVTSFQLTDAAGNLIPTQILADPTIYGVNVSIYADQNLKDSGALVMVPVSQLAANTTYTVTFKAVLAQGATPIDQQWSFTTGQ